MLAKLIGVRRLKYHGLWLAAFLFAFLNLGFPGPAENEDHHPPAQAGTSDLWYVVKIAGQPAGYVHETTKIQDRMIRIDWAAGSRSGSFHPPRNPRKDSCAGSATR
jgi:hypothetical protein